MTTVVIKPFFSIKEIMGRSELEVQVDAGTSLIHLLRQLAEDYGPEFKDALFDRDTDEVSSHYLILVNGKVCYRLEKGLDTPLKDGDVVSIMMYLAGG